MRNILQKKAFTLIEVLIAVIIVAILVVMSQPIYVGRKRKAEYQSALAQIRTIAAAEKTYYVSWNYLPGTVTTTETNAALAINIRDTSFSNYRVISIAGPPLTFQVQVDYFRGGVIVATYTFDKDGNQISCVPPGPDCLS